MSSPPICVAADAPARRAVWLLWEYGIGAVPVVENGVVVGVITEGGLVADRDLSASTARDVMAVPVVTVSPDTPVREALRTMNARGIGRLPVVDAARRPLGMVARRDLLAAMLPTDTEIRRRVVDRVIDAGGEVLGIAVDHGAVRLRGRVGLSGEIPLIERLVHQIDGVACVDARFTVAGERGRQPARG